MRRLWKCATYLSLTILLSMVVAGISIRVYMVRLRHNAEVLQSRVLVLAPGQSTREDVERLIEENRSSFSGESCKRNHCLVSLTVSSWTSRQGCQYLSEWAEIFGMTAFSYTAKFDLTDDTVTRVESGMFQNPCRGKYLHRNLVSAELIKVDKFRPDDLRTTSSLSRHSDYALCGANSRRESDYLRVGTSGDTARSDHIRELDLSCLGSSRGCSVSKLLPVAYSDWQVDVGVLGEPAMDCTLAWWEWGLPRQQQ